MAPYPPKAAYAFALIDWLEREGTGVDFCSGLDISSGDANLDQYGTLLTIGHDEYWTANQHDAVREFRNSGGHTIFLGGNLGEELVRETTDRTAIEYYDFVGSESLDPLATAVSPAPNASLTGHTYRLRDEGVTPTTGVYNYVHRPGSPQELLTGGAMWYWELSGGPSRPPCGFTICNADHWVFDELKLQDGETFGAEIKLIGHEADGLEVEFHNSGPQLTFADGALPGTKLLAVADCRHWGEWDFSAWPPTFILGRPYHPAGSGGVVTMICQEQDGKGMLFSAPTTDWVFGLLPTVDWTATRSFEPPLLPADPIVEQVTRNVLLASQQRRRT
ncbi:hypothetical protein CK222_30450 [Mesorhizobium sp. WSM3866]|nr:N,N-dimethylformamidase beta subunit family domain-containing protein [Mesorhizobium sp. WSM3866]PBB40015.1 hypothetical protein CK222_30450 [Mesorhizobium sp. WSM3866]